MNAIDAAKEVVRMASTAGLTKDVIDLMEKKLALLTDEVALLTKQNSVLTSKNLQLETDNVHLRAQSQNPKQVAKLDDKAAIALKHIFNSHGLPVPEVEIAQLLKCDQNSAKYYLDILLERDFIRFNPASVMLRMSGPKPAGYTVTAAGRKYVMEQLSAL